MNSIKLLSRNRLNQKGNSRKMLMISIGPPFSFMLHETILFLTNYLRFKASRVAISPTRFIHSFWFRFWTFSSKCYDPRVLHKSARHLLSVSLLISPALRTKFTIFFSRRIFQNCRLRRNILIILRCVPTTTRLIFVEFPRSFTLTSALCL